MKSTDDLNGMTGVIEAVHYAQTEEATSVLLDDIGDGYAYPGAYFRDNELEAE
ncbi:hypothetical protein ACFQ71_03140 [Streptomyces sp. NPDC056534]|uniref:hypothetical protein n=1 Tax=Streptomyces sp. NPDC056534 TaxID=3345857 RepID=UPI003693236A